MSLLMVEPNIFSKRRSTSFYAMLAFLYILVSLFNIGYVTGEQCIVTAPAGTFRGVSSGSRSILTPGFGICNFIGIRYAIPPTGNLRFARPVPVGPLPGGIYDATTDGNECPQVDPLTFAYVGDEDCLFLNVYVPHQVQYGCSRKLLPVMVFYHGSGFLGGSSNSTTYGPDYLVPKGVILVTFNYRLNVFAVSTNTPTDAPKFDAGFLNLKDKACSGNMGLADGILALKWVQQNIRSFGGDPNAVTLFGENLFGKAIIESTVFTDESYLVRDPDQVLNSSIQIAQYCGYQGNPDDHAAVLTYLRSLPANTLTQAYFRFLIVLLQNDSNEFYHTHGAPLIPCKDYYVKDGIIPASFKKMGEKVRPIPILIGFLNRDSTVQVIAPDFVDYVKSNLTYYLREADPIFVKDQETQDTVVAQVLAHYYNPDNNDNEFDESLKLVNFLSYYNFYKLISYLRASYVTGNIRTYEFNFADGGPYDIAFKSAFLGPNANLVNGAAHGEEVFYLFYSNLLQLIPLSVNEIKVTYEMSTWWTNFAKTGNPNSFFDGIGVLWEASTPFQNKYLDINNETRLVNTKINQEDYDFFAGLENAIISNRGRQNTVPVPHQSYQRPYLPVDYPSLAREGAMLALIPL